MIGVINNSLAQKKFFPDPVEAVFSKGILDFKKEIYDQTIFQFT